MVGGVVSSAAIARVGIVWISGQPPTTATPCWRRRGRLDALNIWTFCLLACRISLSREARPCYFATLRSQLQTRFHARREPFLPPTPLPSSFLNAYAPSHQEGRRSTNVTSQNKNSRRDSCVAFVKLSFKTKLVPFFFLFK